MDFTEKLVIDCIKKHQEVSSKDLFEKINSTENLESVSVGYATLKRILTKLISEKYLSTRGKGKATLYVLSPIFELLEPVDMEAYYELDDENRNVKEFFNFELIEKTLPENDIFTKSELEHLQQLQNRFQEGVATLSKSAYNKELERLAIDLSWKSSQIEGNTYSLLETEVLLKERKTAIGKTQEEAIMLLNHKDAINFIVENPKYLSPLTISKIEDIHTLLIKDLDIDRNLRKRRVGISGTNYRPLDNEFKIKEALNISCDIINNKQNVFEKSLLALTLLSYIQPFMDGNKRTARIICNALLMDGGACPISFRTINSLTYKKSILLFYEQNNITEFKKIFINQVEFAVDNYF